MYLVVVVPSKHRGNWKKMRCEMMTHFPMTVGGVKQPKLLMIAITCLRWADDSFIKRDSLLYLYLSPAEGTSDHNMDSMSGSFTIAQGSLSHMTAR